MQGAPYYPRAICDCHGPFPAPCRTSENQVVRPGEQDLYIKLTYSVIREDVSKDGSQSNSSDDKQKKPPKWHMSTSFLTLPCPTADELHTSRRRVFH